MALALLGSFISLYYYLIVLKVIFVDESTPSHEVSPIKFDLLQKLSIIILASAVLLLGIMPAPLAARIIASLP